MTTEERKPILQDSGIHKSGGSGKPLQTGQQHLIIQPIEFDHKHRNLYGYLALAAFVLVLINYLMIKERACQITFVNGQFYNYELIQGFHMTVIIVGIVVFVLSYFNFAVVIHEFKILFYSSALIIFVCAGILIYNVVEIYSNPCVSIGNPGTFLGALDATPIIGGSDIFSASDKIGITVFIFDIIASGCLFLAGRRFYQRC